MNSQSNAKVLGFFCSVLLILSSCNKVIDWGLNNFQAADLYAEKYIDSVQSYFRSASVYARYFTDVGQFTALLLSGNVRKGYVDYYSFRNSLDLEDKKMLLHRLVDENNHFVSFYVTGDQPVTTYNSSKAYFTGAYRKHGALMGTSNPAWKPHLVIDGKEHKPHHVKKVDLPLEYKRFFGDRVSQFKKVYLVMFDVRLNDKPHDVSLVLRSADANITLDWKQVLYGVGAPVEKKKLLLDQ